MGTVLSTRERRDGTGGRCDRHLVRRCEGVASRLSDDILVKLGLHHLGRRQLPQFEAAALTGARHLLGKRAGAGRGRP
eukprot:6214749-Pleurochrysis_carterae.AAC.2